MTKDGQNYNQSPTFLAFIQTSRLADWVTCRLLLNRSIVTTWKIYYTIVNVSETGSTRFGCVLMSYPAEQNE